MKRPLLICFTLVLSILLSTDSFARGRGGSSFGGSRSSGLRSSPRPSSPSRSTSSNRKPGRTTFSKKASPAKKATVSKKATAPSGVSKKIAQKNAEASKKYGKGKEGRKAAITDFRETRATKVQKEWDSKPAKRPDYVPERVTVNNRQVDVVFHSGGYGYYAGGVWTPLDYAVHMAVNDAMLMNYGYGYYGAYSRYRNPTVTDPEAQRTHARTNQILLFILLGMFGFIVIMLLVITARNS